MAVGAWKAGKRLARTGFLDFRSNFCSSWVLSRPLALESGVPALSYLDADDAGVADHAVFQHVVLTLLDVGAAGAGILECEAAQADMGAAFHGH